VVAPRCIWFTGSKLTSEVSLIAGSVAPLANVRSPISYRPRPARLWRPSRCLRCQLPDHPLTSAQLIWSWTSSRHEAEED